MYVAMRDYIHSIHATEEGVRFPNGFVHWILAAPIEKKKAHSWQKLDTRDQESLPIPSATFHSFLVSPMTIQHMEFFFTL